MKILIVKTSSLGDLTHVFPVIEYLRAKCPLAKIDWVVEKPYAEMIEAHPEVNQALVMDSKRWRKGLWKRAVWREILSFKKRLQATTYDVLFDLQGNTKSGIATGFAYAKTKVGFSKGAVSEWPNLLFTKLRYAPPAGCNIRQDYVSLVQQYYHDNGSFSHSGQRLLLAPAEMGKIKSLLAAPQLSCPQRILVCPGSIWKNKQLSKEALLDFLKLIAQDRPCSFLFAWGSGEERLIAEQLQAEFPSRSLVIERLPLPTLQNLMAEVDLVVAMDSLPLHLAGTVGVATFSAFGASSAAKYKPEGKQHLALQGTCPYGRQFERRCPVLRTCPTGLCIKGLSGEDLFARYTHGGDLPVNLNF